MWSSYHKTATHSDAACRTRPANRPNDNALFAQVRSPGVSEVCSSWDLPVRDEPDEKPCMSYLAREVQPSTKPAKACVKEAKEAGNLGQPRQQRRRAGKLAAGHLPRVLSRLFPLEGP